MKHFVVLLSIVLIMSISPTLNGMEDESSKLFYMSWGVEPLLTASQYIPTQQVRFGSLGAEPDRPEPEFITFVVRNTKNTSENMNVILYVTRNRQKEMREALNKHSAIYIQAFPLNEPIKIKRKHLR